jgi:hypothetical protein
MDFDIYSIFGFRGLQSQNFLVLAISPPAIGIARIGAEVSAMGTDENAGAKGEMSKKEPLLNPRSTPTPSGIVTHEKNKHVSKKMSTYFSYLLASCF